MLQICKPYVQMPVGCTEHAVEYRGVLPSLKHAKVNTVMQELLALWSAKHALYYRMHCVLEEGIITHVRVLQTPWMLPKTTLGMQTNQTGDKES